VHAAHKFLLHARRRRPFFLSSARGWRRRQRHFSAALIKRPFSGLGKRTCEQCQKQRSIVWHTVVAPVTILEMNKISSVGEIHFTRVELYSFGSFSDDFFA
jgi:hypothetical protein